VLLNKEQDRTLCIDPSNGFTLYINHKVKATGF